MRQKCRPARTPTLAEAVRECVLTGANGRPWAGSQSLRVALPGGETDDPPPTIFRLKFFQKPFGEHPCVAAQDRVLFPNSREIPRREPRHEGVGSFNSEEPLKRERRLCRRERVKAQLQGKAAQA